MAKEKNARPGAMPLHECCEVLGLRGRVDRKTVRQAFRRRVRACHPDLNPGRPGAEAELRRVIRACRTLEEYLARPDAGRLEAAFRATGRGACAGSTEPQSRRAGTLTRLSLWGLASGGFAGLGYVVATGGPAALLQTPALAWCVAGLALLGALAGGVAAAEASGRFLRHNLLSGGVAGAALGIIAAVVYILLLDAFLLDPARAWAVVAFASGGGLSTAAAAAWKEETEPSRRE